MASEATGSGSVFDILYADERRISSLLSQLNDEGVQTELTRSAEDTSTTNLELSVKVVRGGSTEVGRESKTVKVDASWLAPVLFLDAAQDRINRDIEKAAIGSLVIVTGKLVVNDLSLLKDMWSQPAVRRSVLNSVNQAKEADATIGMHRQQRRSAKPKADNSQQEMLLEIMPLLPHTPQMHLITEDVAVWGTINPHHMVGTVGDLILKHGAKVPGSWSVVGILDGVPFELREEDDDYEDHDDILSISDRIKMGMIGENVWKVGIDMAGPARQALGRPLNSYGITPLVVFREIER